MNGTANETLRDYRQNIVEQALRLLGKTSIRYIAGHPERGQSPDEGFDCSGFVRYVLAHCGLYIPDFTGMDGRYRQIRHASEFWDHYGVMTHIARPGDLIFFSRHGLWPTHIGIVRDEESYVHAPGSNGTRVEIAAIESRAIAPLSQAEEVLYEHNPIGYKAPTVIHDTPTYRYHQQAIR